MSRRSEADPLSADLLKGRCSNRLNRAPCELDALLPTKQTQKHEYTFMRAQSSEHPNLRTQRSADHPRPAPAHQGRSGGVSVAPRRHYNRSSPCSARLSAIRSGGRSEEPALTFDGDTANGSIADCRLLLQPLRHKLQEGDAIKRCERPRGPVDNVKLRIAERGRRH